MKWAYAISYNKFNGSMPSKKEKIYQKGDLIYEKSVYLSVQVCSG